MKGLFDSPLFQKIARLADFFLASLLWLLTSLPIITVIPATIAMYYSTVKVVRYIASEFTVQSFFHSFKTNFKQGLWLSVLYILAGIILYTFVDVANAVGMETLYSKVYMVLTVLYSIALVGISLCLIPIVSRFDIGTLSAIKLSLRFIGSSFKKLIPYVIAMVGVAVFCYIIPPLILVLPAGFCYSLSNYAEPLMNEYMEDNIDETMETPHWLLDEEETEE